MTDGQDQEYRIKPKRRMSTGAKIFIVAGVLGVSALGLYPILQDAGLAPRIETSQPDEFQAPEGDGFARITVENEPAEAPITVPQFDPGPLEEELDAQRRASEAEAERLAAEVAQLQEQLSRLANRPSTDNSAELAEALRAVQEQNAALIEQLQNEMDTRLQAAELEAQRRDARDREAQEAADQRMSDLMEQITLLQRENTALQEQIETGMSDALRDQAQRDRQALEEERQRVEEEQRRAELEARRAEAEALRDAQIRSDGVIFDNGRSSGAAETPAESAVASNGQTSPDAAARAFIQSRAEPVTVTTAEVIANPSNTVLQGTVIRATLETAIDSSLPGPVTATVNYPVYSFDQSRVLIPEGSVVFGSYSSDVSLGDQRVLVGWNRIVTPQGQSVQLAAFGADDQGRSGVSGDVNTRFGLRFGSSALLSIIGAAPSIAAAEADSEVGAEVARDIGENFETATDTVIGEYATLPPIISVQSGTSITVIVDRDLEFF